CAGRHHLPDRLPAPRLCRAFQPDPASRLRIRRVVLAFRRRGVAVPFHLHLRLGPRRRIHGARRALTPTLLCYNGAPAKAALFVSSRENTEEHATPDNAHTERK